MSKLYGTLTNQDSKTSTRCASSIITAAAQSYEGSVAVTIRYQDGIPVVDIAASPGSNADPSRVLATFYLADLVREGTYLSIIPGA
jgi:hypothetical protein